MSPLSVTTPVGPARVHLAGPQDATLLVLGHGAGGRLDSPDLGGARDAALAAGLGVALVEQPWRVRGARVAEAPARLDQAWLAVVRGLDRPVVVGGRSAGARVACRTATELDALGVLCLAFPLHPPGRPEVTRGPELLLPAVPRLVVQGERDRFGMPEPSEGVEVHVVRGADHSFAVRRRDGRSADEVVDEVQRTVGHWLSQLRR